MTTNHRRSRQRDAILALLCSRTDHPTAEMLYNDLKQDFPNISLGTVYRNLTGFEHEGRALRISDGTGTDRYDGTVMPHYHFCCNNCGTVCDVDIPFEYSLNTRAANATGGVITGQSLIFYGICKNCLKSVDK